MRIGQKMDRGRGRSLENPGKRLDRGRAQAQALEKPGKRMDNLKERLIFSKPKDIYGSLAKTSGQPFTSHLPTLCLSESVPYLFALINLATITKLLCETPQNSFPVTILKNLFPLVTVPLFAIAKIRKQTKCPSADEYINRGIYISAIQKSNPATCSNIDDLEDFMGSDLSQYKPDSETHTHTKNLHDLTYMWNPK